jgi:hypothetical protein
MIEMKRVNEMSIRTLIYCALMFLIVSLSCKKGDSGTDIDIPALKSVSVTPVSGFVIQGGIPNAVYDSIEGKVRLIYSSSVGLVEALSEDGINFQSVGVRSKRLDTLLAPINKTAVDVLMRLTSGGIRRFFARGLPPPGPNETGYIHIANELPNGRLQVVPGPVYTGGPSDGERLGVPDIIKTADGRWRMFYVAMDANPGNSRTAISSDEGLSWSFESDNPFGDISAGGTAATNNVDPAPIALVDGRYFAFTMREKLLYAFWSSDGLNFQEHAGFVLTSDAFPDTPQGSFGLFDPTLVELPNGELFLYVTAGDNPGGSVIVAAQIVLEWQ